MCNHILNEEQRKILNSKNNINLVISGPGTGKTLLIVNKYKQLLLKIKKPERILVLSYTKNSSKNIRNKLSEFKLADLKVRTLDSQFLEMLNGLEKYVNFKINEDISLEIIKDIFKQRDWEKFFSQKKDYINFLRKLKYIITINNRKLNKHDIDREYYTKLDLNIDPIEIESALKALNLKNVMEAIYKYNENLKKNFVWDYMDITINTFNELINNEEFRKKWEAKFDAILIDEFQDLDMLKMKIISMLYQPKKTHMLFVGDPHQNIYGFRGTTNNSIDVIRELFPTPTIHHLSINYRNTPEIIEMANKIIALDSDHKEYWLELKTNRAKNEGGIEYISSSTYEEEHRKISQRIQKLIYIKNECPENIAILYRKGTNSKRIDNLKKTLSDYGIPFITSLGEEVENENYVFYKQIMGKYVCLTTIHKSKSREWKYVFIISMDEREFPCIQAINSGNINEERRLAYVAFTRTKEKMVLSSGSENVSRFLKELGFAQ